MPPPPHLFVCIIADCWRRYRTKEFKLTPTRDATVPLLIDGDPEPIAPAHVTVKHRAVSVFSPPKNRDGTWITTPLPPTL